MRVAVSGASGMVGRSLCTKLLTAGHQPVAMVRSDAGGDEVYWSAQSGEIDAVKLGGVDAVVHLAGESIADGRWTKAKKQRIRDSRVKGTRLISETLGAIEPRPKIMICASAIGYYGDRGDEILTEESPSGNGFLPDVCVEWEQATAPAKDAGVRVVNLRIGVILSKKGGALAKMLTPFKMCVGGKVGSGRQYWSWIALEDVVDAILFCLENDSVTGPVNAVSPNPVTNREFTATLGEALRRPTIIPMPAFAAKLALGEMAEDLLLASTRVLPTKLERHGYKFQHPELPAALSGILDE